MDKLIKKFTVSLRSLDGTEGRPIARRNARKRVLGALRALRAAVDDSFPAIVSREGVKRLTPEGRLARFKRRGWKEVSAQSTLIPICAEAGIRVHRNPVQRAAYFVPSWVYFVWKGCEQGKEVSSLRAAKKDLKLRNAAIAKAALLKE